MIYLSLKKEGIFSSSTCVLVSQVPLDQPGALSPIMEVPTQEHPLLAVSLGLLSHCLLSAWILMPSRAL